MSLQECVLHLVPELCVCGSSTERGKLNRARVKLSCHQQPTNFFVSSGCLSCSLPQVLHLVADVLQQHGSLATDPDPLTPANLSHASPDVRAAVAATLRRQYTIQHVTTLGHGSVTHLVQAAVAKFQSGELQLTPWLRHALVLTSTAQSTQQPAIAFSSAFGQRSDTSAGQDAARDNQGDDISMLDAPAAAESVTGSSVPRDSQQQVGTGPGFGSWQGQGQGSASAAAEGEGFGAVVGVLGDVGRSRAVAVLCSIPEMADLHSASCWDVVFAPELGPLEGFVRREGAACGEWWLRVLGHRCWCCRQRGRASLCPSHNNNIHYGNRETHLDTSSE